jgi:hypothetical protein
MLARYSASRCSAMVASEDVRNEDLKHGEGRSKCNLHSLGGSGALGGFLAPLLFGAIVVQSGRCFVSRARGIVSLA